MRRLLLLLLFPVIVSAQQYKLLAVKDTTGFPPITELGRVVFINGVAWQNLTGGWVRSSATFLVPTDCKGLYFVLFSDATGGTTDNLSVAEFQLTEGEEIVEYVATPFAEELAKCQRFFCKTFAYGTVPAQNAGVATGPAMAPILVAGTGALAGTIFWRFPVKMWKTPTTVTSYSPGAVSVEVYNITQAVAHTATTAVAQLDESVCFTSTGGTGGALGQRCGLHITASAEVVV